MTVFDYMEEHILLRPENIALTDGIDSITYMELYRLLGQGQKLYIDKGFQAGDNIGIKIHNRLEWVIAFMSLLSINCWVVLLPPEATDRELEEIASLAKLKGIIEGFDFRQLRHLCLEDYQFVNPKENETGVYHATSGSTGKPKLCVRTLKGLTLEGLSYKVTLNLQSTDKILCLPPVYHSYCLGAGCMASLVSGSCLYLVDRFVPRNAVRVVQNEGITILLLVPIMARAMSYLYAEEKKVIPQLRIALVGTGSITEEVYLGFLNKYGSPLLSNYGSTETGGVITRLTPIPRDSIGKPMNGVEIKIIDDNGELVQSGSEGELSVRCDGMMSGYLNEEATKIDQEGFFAMGDIAVQDNDGYLYIKGRKKNIINIGGKKVNPSEVETILCEYPGVKECVVVGYVKSSGEEGVKAILAGENLEEQKIRSYCQSRLSSHKVPGIIEFCEALPRNELGKLKREELLKGCDHV
ncbi:MAG: class I adenylate-forming enzyme family protein [Clostridia bacterium]